MSLAVELHPTPGRPETAAVRSMFDRIAPRYDLLNHLLSAGIDRRWRRAALHFAELSAGAQVLDLCTGTGDLLIEALVRGRGAGVGADLSSAMLRRAGRKLEARGLGARARLVAADVERLPLAGESFDAALVAFGIRNVSRPEQGLAEAARVLRRGGRLVVLEFSMPRGALGAVYRVYFTRVLPFVGGLVSGDREAYAYLPASVERFARPEAFVRLLEQAGFQDVRARPLSAGIAHVYRGDRR